MTKNHNYNTPSEGTVDWHVPLNDNFERLDRDVEIRDVEGNLETYAPDRGAKFLATDTERVYVADGDEWRALRSTGRNPAVDSLRTGEVNDVPIITDAGNAQTKLDAADAAGVGEVWVANPIELDEPLVIPRGLTVRGQGTFDWIDRVSRGAGFYGDFDDELVILQRWGRLTGLCVENQGADGVGIRCDGYTVVDNCHVFARAIGLHTRKHDGWDAETKIRNNVFVSDTGSGSGSIGVYTEDVPDIECHDNMVVGFMTGVHLDQGEQQVTENHVYTGTVDAIDYGFRFDGRVRFIGNKTGVCNVASVEFTSGFVEQVHHNRLLAGDGAYCIHYNFDSPAEISRSRITNNWFESSTWGFVGDAAVKGTNVSGVYDTIIEDNTTEEFENGSLRTANGGEAVVSSQDDATSVSHRLVDRPRPQDITVIPRTPLGSASTWYVGEIDERGFDLCLDSGPGRDVSFTWKARLRDD